MAVPLEHAAGHAERGIWARTRARLRDGDLSAAADWHDLHLHCSSPLRLAPAVVGVCSKEQLALWGWRIPFLLVVFSASLVRVFPAPGGWMGRQGTPGRRPGRQATAYCHDVSEPPVTLHFHTICDNLVPPPPQGSAPPAEHA